MSKIQALQADAFLETPSSPRGFLHVPLHTIYREINLSHNEGTDVILFLHGTGSLAVNVDNSEQA